jgi:DNA repair protein RadC
MNTYQEKPIREWALEDRPREKLLHRGIDSLTDAELIALLLSTGTRELSAIGLARLVLSETGGLRGLASSGVEALMKIRGIGRAKAITLVAGFELGRRKSREVSESPRITSAEVAAAYLIPRLSDFQQEVFHILFLNRNNVVKAEKQLFKGGTTATIIDPKVVFREAVNQLATGIILAHNHPSGSLKPSKADLDITRKLTEGGKLFDIQVIDHLIVSFKGYYSFAENGNL